MLNFLESINWNSIAAFGAVGLTWWVLFESMTHTAEIAAVSVSAVTFGLLAVARELRRLKED
jgi:ABC-type siderophore export system fused ATPase/permease subunit